MLKSVVKICFPCSVMETSSTSKKNEAFSAALCCVGVRSPDLMSIQNIYDC